jgi:hypothetical protein
VNVRFRKGTDSEAVKNSVQPVTANPARTPM